MCSYASFWGRSELFKEEREVLRGLWLSVQALCRRPRCKVVGGGLRTIGSNLQVVLKRRARGWSECARNKNGTKPWRREPTTRYSEVCEPSRLTEDWAGLSLDEEQTVRAYRRRIALFSSLQCTLL